MYSVNYAFKFQKDLHAKMSILKYYRYIHCRSKFARICGKIVSRNMSRDLVKNLSQTGSTRRNANN